MRLGNPANAYRQDSYSHLFGADNDGVHLTQNIFASGAQSLVAGSFNRNTGGAATWTLPVVAATTATVVGNDGQEITVCNDGTGNITVASGTGSQIRSFGADRASVIISPGRTVRFVNDGTRWVSCDSIHVVEMQITDLTTALTTGDGKGIFWIPQMLDKMHMVRAHAALFSAATGGTLFTLQIANATAAWDMLTTKITLDASETTSYTAATQPVIDTASSHDVVTMGDMLRFDVDAIGSGAAGTGLSVIMGFVL